jgi:hypothetical protein
MRAVAAIGAVVLALGLFAMVIPADTPDGFTSCSIPFLEVMRGERSTYVESFGFVGHPCYDNSAERLGFGVAMALAGGAAVVAEYVSMERTRQRRNAEA